MKVQSERKHLLVEDNKIELTVGQLIDELERRTRIRPGVEHIRYLFQDGDITDEDDLIEVDLDGATAWWQESILACCNSEEPDHCAGIRGTDQQPCRVKVGLRLGKNGRLYCSSHGHQGDEEPASEPDPQPSTPTFVSGFHEIDRRKLVDALESIGLSGADEAVLYLFAGEGALPDDPMAILEIVVTSNHSYIGTDRPVRQDLSDAVLRGRYLEVPSYYSWDPWPASIRQDNVSEFEEGGKHEAHNHSFTSNWVRTLVEGLLKARRDYDEKTWNFRIMSQVRDEVMLGDLAVSDVGRRVRQLIRGSRPTQATSVAATTPVSAAPATSAATPAVPVTAASLVSAVSPPVTAPTAPAAPVKKKSAAKGTKKSPKPILTKGSAMPVPTPDELDLELEKETTETNANVQLAANFFALWKRKDTDAERAKVIKLLGKDKKRLKKLEPHLPQEMLDALKGSGSSSGSTKKGDAYAAAKDIAVKAGSRDKAITKLAKANTDLDITNQVIEEVYPS